MQPTGSTLIWFAKYAAGGIVSYSTPRLLIAVGVPLDRWIIEMGHGVSLHMDRDTAIWLVTFVVGVALYVGSVFLSADHKWTPQIPAALKDTFRKTPISIRIFIAVLVLVLGGMSILVWRLSEQALHANEKSAAVVKQIQNHYLEAEQHRRAVADALAASDTDFNPIKKEAEEWTGDLGHWVIKNMGEPAYVRLIKIPTDRPNLNGANAERNHLLFVLTVLQNNLEQLIENRSWDKP